MYKKSPPLVYFQCPQAAKTYLVRGQEAQESLEDLRRQVLPKNKHDSDHGSPNSSRHSGYGAPCSTPSLGCTETTLGEI